MVGDGALVVAGQAPVSHQPAEGTFHDPAAFDDLVGVRAGALDEVEGDAGGFVHPVPQRLAVVAGGGAHELQCGDQQDQAADHEPGAGLVAGAGGGDGQGQRPALGVHDEAPAAAFDLFPAVVAAGRGGPGVCAFYDLGIDDAGGGLFFPAPGRPPPPPPPRRPPLPPPPPPPPPPTP